VGSRLLGPCGWKRPERGLRKGDLKFNLAGEKLQGSWVLVRMHQDRDRNSKRNNWLLIKHRDGYEQEDGPSVTDHDRSVASGRTMEEIAAGKGRRPKPFMLAGKAAASDAHQGCRTGIRVSANPPAPPR
jgi:bifunctional non-homologous end joining protein LigD